MYQDQCIERHHIIEFCRLYYNLDNDLSPEEAMKMKILSDRLKGEINVITCIDIDQSGNHDELSKKGQMKKWFDVINPV